jgi:hypothetical protein
MNRKDLLDKLDIIQDGLSSSDMIPVLSHIWFTGSHVMAYNGQISIQAPHKTSFQGAMPRILLQLLRQSRAKDVEFEPDGDGVLVKAASSKMRLPLLASKEFVFEMPKSGKSLITFSKKLAQAIEICLRSVGNDPSEPDQLGVTLIPEGGKIRLYSTNNATLSYVVVDVQLQIKGRVTLATEFCKQILSIAKKSDVKFEICDDYCLATTSNGVALFGQHVVIDKPYDFADVIKHNLPDNLRKSAVPIPTKLQLVLERAIIVTDSPTEQTKTVISVREGRMRFVSKSSRGEVVDQVQVGDGQEEVTAKIDCKSLKVGYGVFSHMLLTDRCFIMTKDDAVYMVAASG